jgi:hypothetical protein
MFNIWVKQTDITIYMDKETCWWGRKGNFGVGGAGKRREGLKIRIGAVFQISFDKYESMKNVENIV